MKTILRLTISGLLLLGVIIAPTSVTAGGGGGGEKIAVMVRIKNMTRQDANAPIIALESVEIGDPMNEPISVNDKLTGQVNDAFRMTKYEVTIANYLAFLNTVAKRGDGANATVIASLYDSRMASDANIAGIARSGSGTEASPYVYSAIGDPKKPIAYVDWFSAARFANWMHNGATATADIETGAYNLAGGFNEYVHRQPTAKWWIPSHDEWFKAAYYKGGSASAGYWMFPTRADTACENTPSTGSNHANSFQLGSYAVTQASTLDSTQNYLTAVGTFVNSPGPYGTFDQGGNLEEWTDDVVYSPSFGASRRTRGGAWSSGGLNSDVNPIPTALATDRSSKIGFRLARSASAQEPAGSSARTFIVEISEPRTLMPDQIVQYRVSRGEFTLKVNDSEVTTLAKAIKINTGFRKNIYITVSGDGTQVTVAETNTPH